MSVEVEVVQIHGDITRCISRRSNNPYDIVQELQKAFDTFIDRARGYQRDDSWKRKLVLAIHQEISEAIDWTPWKWWKASELKRDELVEELIDILHFFASFCNIAGIKISDLPRETIDANIEDLLDYASFLTSTYRILVSGMAVESVNGIVGATDIDEWFAMEFWPVLVSLFRKLGLDDNIILEEYTRKNRENFVRQFRKDFREGTYYIGDEKLEVVRSIAMEICKQK